MISMAEASLAPAEVSIVHKCFPQKGELELCTCRYGNTSSGSLWYALSYIESCQRVKKGETVWQVSTAIKFLAQCSKCQLNTMLEWYRQELAYW